MIFFYYCKYFKYLIFRTAIAKRQRSPEKRCAQFCFLHNTKKTKLSSSPKLLLNFWYKKYDHMFDET